MLRFSREQPIDIVVRHQPSGTQDASGTLHGDREGAARARPEGLEERSGRGRRSQTDNPNASDTCRWRSPEGCHRRRLPRVSPGTLRNAKSGRVYDGVRNFWMVTRGPAQLAARRSSSAGSSTAAGRPSGSSPDGMAVPMGLDEQPGFGPRPGGRIGATGAPSDVSGALAWLVLVLIAGMIAVRLAWLKAWPSFSHNGLASVAGSGGNVDRQADQDIFNWPGIRTRLTTSTRHPCVAAAVRNGGRNESERWCSALQLRGLRRNLHRRVRTATGFAGVLEPVVRLLRRGPSVIFGLIGCWCSCPWWATV